MLDLTAVFNTFDHDLLMLRFERQFALCSVVLQWSSSYLSDWSFRVVLGSNRSSVVHRLCSTTSFSYSFTHVHYVMYTTDLANFVGERQVNFHSFADDSQTYMHCSLGDVGLSLIHI